MKEEPNIKNTIEVALADAKRGQLNLINAGTGTGKTYTVLTADHWDPSSQILFLVSRKAIKDSVVKKYGVSSKQIKSDNKNIFVSTYHDFLYYRDGAPDGSDWDYVICDEFHALFRDGAYSQGFALTIRWIGELVRAKKCVVIGMSATMDSPVYFFRQKNIDIKTEILVKAYTKNSPTSARLGFGGAAMAKDLVDKTVMEDKKLLVYNQDLVDNETSAEVIGPKAISICSDYAKPVKDPFNANLKRDVAKIRKPEKDFIIENERFPDGVEIVFSTNATVEGINVDPKKQSLDVIIAQADDLDDIIQAAGRYRGNVSEFNVVMRNLDTILKGIQQKEKQFSESVALASRYEDTIKSINNVSLTDEERGLLVNQSNALARQMGRNPLIDTLDSREHLTFDYELKWGYMAHLWRLKSIFEEGEQAVIEYLSLYLQTPVQKLTHGVVKKEKAQSMLNKIAQENLNKEIESKELKAMINGIKLTSENSSHQMSYKRRIEILNELGYAIVETGRRRSKNQRLTYCMVLKTGGAGPCGSYSFANQ